MKVLSNVVGDSNGENNFPHKWLLTNTQVSKFLKTFANNSSANIKLLKTQLHKIRQSAGFLGRLLGPLPTFSLPFPLGLRRRSDVSFRSHMGRDVADNAETSQLVREWAELFETSFRRLIGT